MEFDAQCLFAWLRFSCSVSSHSPATASDAVRTVHELLSVDAEVVDPARAKLIVDKLVDPSVDIDERLRTIERMASDVTRLIPPGADGWTKVRALQRYLYEAGVWNGYRPFAYDLDDPLGRVMQNRLLSDYLDDRRGNCVTMRSCFSFSLTGLISMSRFQPRRYISSSSLPTIRE